MNECSLDALQLDEGAVWREVKRGGTCVLVVWWQVLSAAP